MVKIIPLDIFLYDTFKNNGMQLRNRIIWHFGHGLHCKKRLSGRYETILWFTKTDDYTFNLDPIRVPQKYPNKKHFKGDKRGQLSCNPLGKNPSDIWDIPNVKNNHPEKTEHPCQFPIELIDRLVLSLTNENDIIFDPYLGTGTSVISALRNNRSGIGCEILKKKKIFNELKEFILSLDAERFKSKESKEKHKMGRLLYSPKDINNAFKNGLSEINWERGKHNFDFLQDKVSLEIQLGKYAFIAHDITFKHSLAFINQKIDVGIEVLPDELLGKNMSSGVDSLPRAVNIIKQLRGIICVPILLIGINP